MERIVMSNRKILRKVAKQNGATLKEVRSEIQTAINYAYDNCNNEITKAYQNRVPRKNSVPTADELINYATNAVKNKQNK